MRESKRFIVIKKGIIQRDYCTSDGIRGVNQAIVTDNINYDEIIEIPLWAETQHGRHIDEYRDDWKYKPLQERVNMGRVEHPKGFKIKGNEFVPKTMKEKIDDGELKIERGCKYNPETDQIEQMTEAEIILSGLVTQAELDEKKLRDQEEALIKAEIRKLAIERIGNRLKVVKE